MLRPASYRDQFRKGVDGFHVRRADRIASTSRAEGLVNDQLFLAIYGVEVAEPLFRLGFPQGKPAGGHE